MKLTEKVGGGYFLRITQHGQDTEASCHTKLLIYPKAESIATVTLNRPEKRNASTTQMSEDVVDVFKVMEDDPEVLVTVLTAQERKPFPLVRISVIQDPPCKLCW